MPQPDDKMITRQTYVIDDPQAPARLHGHSIIATLYRRSPTQMYMEFQNTLGDPSELSGQEMGYLRLFTDSLGDKIKAGLLEKNPDLPVENMFNRVDVDKGPQRQLQQTIQEPDAPQRLRNTVVVMVIRPATNTSITLDLQFTRAITGVWTADELAYMKQFGQRHKSHIEAGMAARPGFRVDLLYDGKPEPAASPAGAE